MDEHGASPARKAQRDFADYARSADLAALFGGLAICIGAYGYMTAAEEPPGLIVAAGLVATLGLYIGARRIGLGLWATLPALVLLGLSAGAAAGKIRAALVAAPVIAERIGPLMVEGWVRQVEPRADGVRLRIAVHAVSGLGTGETPSTVRLTHTAPLAVAPGRFVRCWAVLRPPPGPAIPGDYDFRRQAWFEGLGGVGYVQGRCRGGALGAPTGRLAMLRLWIDAKRRRLAEYVFSAAGPRAGGFAAAVASGDRSFMAEADRRALRESGLAHLLAISGLHMAIVGGLAFFIFRRGLALIEPLALRTPVQKPAAVAALLVSFIYLVLSGGGVSTQRAFIMAAVFFGAILVDRPAFGLRSFALALSAVALLQPEGVVAPGFQMSFAATGVLIAVHGAWTERRAYDGGRGWASGPVLAIKSLVLTSVAAAAATAPYAIFHFDRVAGFGLASNLVAMPIVTFAAAPAAAFAVAAAPLGGAELGLAAFGLTLEAILFVAHLGADLSSKAPMVLPKMPPAALAGFTAALVAVIAARGPWRIVLSMSFLVSGVAAWALAPRPALIWSPSGEVLIERGPGRYERRAFIDGEALGPLGFEGAEEGPSCADAPCRVATEAGAVLLMPEFRGDIPCGESDLRLILTASTDHAERDQCAAVLSWARLQARGGAAIFLPPGGGVRIKHALAERGARPWRPLPGHS